jgi:hypothetical protein
MLMTDTSWPRSQSTDRAMLSMLAASPLRYCAKATADRSSAPGVDVLVAEGEGTAYRTGTSYAAAVLSALIAHEIGAGKLEAGADARDLLRAASEDLGQTGRDAQFGWGLPRLPECGTVSEARESGN